MVVYRTRTGKEATKPQRSKIESSQEIKRLPPALGVPEHVSSLSRQRRWDFAQALHYFRQNVFTIILPDYSAIDVWARAMFWHPSAFYACQYSTAVHQDLVAGRVTESVSPVAIACLGKCLELLQQELSAPVLKPEMALMTVGLLANNKPDKETMKAMYDTAPLDFESLLETPTSLQVWSQLQYAEPHADMMHWLIRKLGGLEKLQTPGLALTVAYVDLKHSSLASRRPVYECYWRWDSGILHSHPSYTLARGEKTPGQGFFVEAVAGLTPRALAVLLRLAAVNCLLERLDVKVEAKLHPDRFFRIRDVRNAAQHSLLSLEKWDDLPADQQIASHWTVYDCSVLTAIIYSNAVLMDLPHHTGWHTSSAEKLRSILLSEYTLSSWPTSMHGLLLWCLMIGGIAASHSPSRIFYDNSLRDLLRKLGRPSWKSTQRILDDYLWSSRACRHGAALLWQAL